MDGSVSSLDSSTVFLCSFQMTTSTDLICSIIVQYSLFFPLFYMVRLGSGKRSEICWAIGCRITYSLQISFLDSLFFYPTYYINACVLFL